MIMTKSSTDELPQIDNKELKKEMNFKNMREFVSMFVRKLPCIKECYKMVQFNKDKSNQPIKKTKKKKITIKYENNDDSILPVKNLPL